MNTNIVEQAAGRRFPVRPDYAHSADGYVYVVRFSDETTKVGRTINPDKRLDQHHHDGKKFGLTIVRWWVSDLHRNYDKTERSLISFSKGSGSIQGGNEYFTDLDFDEAVRHVGSFPISESTSEQAAADEAKREAAFEKWMAVIRVPLSGAGHRITVDSPTAAWVLSYFFDPVAALPQVRGEVDHGTFEAMLTAVQTSAARNGRDPHEISQWSSYDYMCHLLDLLTYSAKLEMKIKAINAGADDFFSPWSAGVSA